MAAATHNFIDAYLTHLRVERRLADHTLESYSRDLQRLGAFAAGLETPILGLDRRALEHFVAGMMSEGLSPRSCASGRSWRGPPSTPITCRTSTSWPA